MIILYQFPISHYCEKVRWALAFKGLPFQAKNLLPGPHIKTVKRFAKNSSVPVIVDGDTTVQGSADIISYLDSAYPERPLTPTTESEREQCLRWESFADKEIGVHVRRVCYQELLDRPDLLIPLFTHEGPWFGRVLLPFFFKGLSAKMRKFMNISAATAKESLAAIDRAVTELDAARSSQGYLVGDSFTRADLTAAALLAPLVQPRGYGVPWPGQYPGQLGEIASAYADRLSWVGDLYQRYRTGRDGP